MPTIEQLRKRDIDKEVWKESKIEEKNVAENVDLSFYWLCVNLGRRFAVQALLGETSLEKRARLYCISLVDKFEVFYLSSTGGDERISIVLSAAREKADGIVFGYTLHKAMQYGYDLMDSSLAVCEAEAMGGRIKITSTRMAGALVATAASLCLTDNITKAIRTVDGLVSGIGVFQDLNLSSYQSKLFRRYFCFSDNPLLPGEYRVVASVLGETLGIFCKSERNYFGGVLKYGEPKQEPRGTWHGEWKSSEEEAKQEALSWAESFVRWDNVINKREKV